MVAESGGRPPPKRRAPARRRRPGEGSVYRRGSRWTAMVDLGYVTGPDGKRRRRRVTVTADTAEEAARELRRLRSRADVGLLPQDGAQTVADFLRAWLDSKAPSIRSTTAAIYRRAIELHLAPFLGHHRLDRLTPAHVQGFIAAELAAGMSATTVRAMVTVLSGALRTALEWGQVTRNVAALAHRPAAVRFPARPLSADEARALLAALEGDDLAALYWLLIGTGLRIGEALALRWQDVDLDARLIHVRHTILRTKAGEQPPAGAIRLTPTVSLVPPKTAASRVTLALPGVVADVLRAHQVAQLAQAAAAGSAWQDLALVFTTPTPKAAGHHRPPGSPVDYLATHRRLRAMLSAAGLPAIRVHDLRHTCAVLLIEGGDANLKQVQRQMRHASIGVTLDVYGHVTDALQARAASDMDGLLGGPKTGTLATDGNTGGDPPPT